MGDRDPFFDDAESGDGDLPDNLWDTVEHAQMRQAASDHRVCWDSTHPGYSGLKENCPHPECVVRSVLGS